MKNNMKNEIWKPVVGFENFYEVSNKGRVKRLKTLVRCSVGNGLKTVKERVLKSSTKPLGYQSLTLSTNGVSHTKYIHRLVAKAFLENKEHKKHVNHIDGNPSNNNLINLEWCTPSENELHKVHVLDKFPNTLNLKYVDNVSDIYTINGKKTIGDKIIKLHKDLIKGIKITSKSEGYGIIKQSIVRLKTKYGVKIKSTPLGDWTRQYTIIQD